MGHVFGCVVDRGRNERLGVPVGPVRGGNLLGVENLGGQRDLVTVE